jgi:hypothetical protein
MQFKTWNIVKPKQKPCLFEYLQLELKMPTHKIQLWRFMKHVNFFSYTSNQVNKCIMYYTPFQSLIGTDAPPSSLLDSKESNYVKERK